MKYNERGLESATPPAGGDPVILQHHTRGLLPRLGKYPPITGLYFTFACASPSTRKTEFCSALLSAFLTLNSPIFPKLIQKLEKFTHVIWKFSNFVIPTVFRGLTSLKISIKCKRLKDQCRRGTRKSTRKQISWNTANRN